MYPILFSHGGLTIYSWGTMLALALVIISYFLHEKFLEEQINPDHLFNLILLCTIFGIVGARLFYVFFTNGVTIPCILCRLSGSRAV